MDGGGPPAGCAGGGAISGLGDPYDTAGAGAAPSNVAYSPSGPGAAGAAQPGGGGAPAANPAGGLPAPIPATTPEHRRRLHKHRHRGFFHRLGNFIGKITHVSLKIAGAIFPPFGIATNIGAQVTKGFAEAL